MLAELLRACVRLHRQRLFLLCCPLDFVVPFLCFLFPFILSKWEWEFPLPLLMDLTTVGGYMESVISMRMLPTYMVLCREAGMETVHGPQTNSLLGSPATAPWLKLKAKSTFLLETISCNLLAYYCETEGISSPKIALNCFVLLFHLCVVDICVFLLRVRAFMLGCAAGGWNGWFSVSLQMPS